MMEMSHRLVQRPEMRLWLTQRMQQAIHILQLARQELDQHIQQEIETNPVLELVQKDPDAEPVESLDSTVQRGDEVEDVAFDLDQYARQWSDLPRTGPDFSRNPDADERRRYYETSITKEESFTSRLLTQLRLAAPDARTYEIGERIIGDIDDKGYFTGSLSDIALEKGVSEQDVEQVLRLIQRFEPTGVGARDVVECLLLQIDAEYPNEPELRTLVGEHLVALERRQIPSIAKAMGITPERVEQLAGLLAKLNPWPGLEYSSDPPHYVTPDVIVDKVDDTYEVYLADGSMPRLRVNEEYARMLSDGKLNRDSKRYLREKVDAAKWLIRNIEQRQQTILRIAKAIVEVQKEFLDKGVEHIKPLTLQEIADRVGVHEATVSRTTRGKYMQTPQGLFEMKYFFSPGLRHDAGPAQASKAVQSLIKKIIDEEDKQKPLSDQKIADLLRQRGLNIARRTVTKYREALGILSTSLRKSYQKTA